MFHHRLIRAFEPIAQDMRDFMRQSALDVHIPALFPLQVDELSIRDFSSQVFIINLDFHSRVLVQLGTIERHFVMREIERYEHPSRMEVEVMLQSHKSFLVGEGVVLSADTRIAG